MLNYCKQVGCEPLYFLIAFKYEAVLLLQFHL